MSYNAFKKMAISQRLWMDKNSTTKGLENSLNLDKASKFYIANIVNCRAYGLKRPEDGRIIELTKCNKINIHCANGDKVKSTDLVTFERLIKRGQLEEITI